jgi:hypothetical protein
MVEEEEVGSQRLLKLVGELLQEIHSALSSYPPKKPVGPVCTFLNFQTPQPRPIASAARAQHRLPSEGFILFQPSAFLSLERSPRCCVGIGIFRQVDVELRDEFVRFRASTKRPLESLTSSPLS